MAKYTPHTDGDVKEMLRTVGVKRVGDLFADVPQEMRLKALSLPKGISQADAEAELNKLAEKNKRFKIILRGAGSYNHYIPPVVRAMSARSEFVTAYTPYQAELSQGILQSVFEYQTMICNLTGMDVSNASHYDGATAAAEAVLMCKDKQRVKVMVAASVKPDTLAVLNTYLVSAGVEIVTAPEEDGLTDIQKLAEILDGSYAAVYLEQPAYNGLIENAEALGKAAHAVGAKFIMSVYPIALGLLKKPSECGADVAVGEGQPLGMPVNFGGPYLGFMATTTAMQRKLPGRIVGETVDSLGNKAYVLTLQAREQHIRREKAGSNICSNEAHCALTAGMYLATMGNIGLTEVASDCTSNAHCLLDALTAVGLRRKYEGEFFNEFVTTCDDADKILVALDKKGILGGLKLNDTDILWCATETVSEADIKKTAAVVKEALKC